MRDPEVRGRDAELAQLAGVLAMARAGTGRLLVVEGAAGMGKTALVAAALPAAPAHASSVTVLRARCGPLDRDFAFGVARQAFAPLQIAPGWDDLRRGPAALADRVLTSGDPPPAGVADATYAAAHGLFCLTAAVATAQPTVLYVDDVHWADPASLRWLAALARRVDELPLALIVTVRSGEPVADPDLLGELTAGAPGTVITLGPLSPAAAGAVVRARRPDASPAQVAACHEAAGGNPFLLTALLSHWPAPAAGVVGGTAAVVAEQVARWVGQRLGRMPDGCAALARGLAVLGSSARLREAAALAGLTPERAAVCADQLRAAGLLGALPAPARSTGEALAEDGLAAANPMIATALEQSFGAGERGVWHARAAAILATGGADPERAAVHLLRAEPAGRPEAVAVLRAAAGRATGRGAPEVATTYLRRALAEPPTGPAEDAAIRIDLALALAAGRREGAVALAHEAVARIADPAARAEAALRCGRALALGAHGEAAIAVCRSGLPTATALTRGPQLDAPGNSPAIGDLTPGGGEGSALTRARLEAEIAAAAGLDSRTMPLVRELVDRCRADPPPLGLWRVLEAVRETFDGRPARLPSGVALDGEVDSLLPTIAGLVMLGNGELAAARAMAEATAAGAGERGWLSTVAHGRFMRSLAVLPAGLVTEAIEDARAATDFKLSSATAPAGLLFALCALVDALVEAGRLDEADAVLRDSCPGEPPPYVLSGPMLLQSRARLRLAQERPAEAVADLRAAGDRWAELDVRAPALASWRAELVAPLLAGGDRAGAEALAREHLALAEAAEVPAPLSVAWRVTALAGPRDRCLSRLERAVKIVDGTPDRLALAYALTDLGSALRRAGRREDARSPLRTALDIASSGGAHRLAARATAELHASGARPRRAAAHGPASLTDAEQQVAALAASGLTNREIALRLRLGRRTIETHLAHAYQKLGIVSRRDLAGALKPSTSI